MPNKLFRVYAVFSLIALTFPSTMALGDVSKAQVDEAVARIDYFGVVEQMAEKAAGDMAKLVEEVGKIHPTYLSKLKELQDLNEKISKYKAAGKSVRTLTRQAKTLGDKIGKIESKIAEVAKDAANSSSGPARFAKLGKALNRLGQAQIAYQAIDKAREGYQKGGVDRALFEGGGSYIDNTLMGEAIAGGATLGAPLGVPGVLVGGGLGLLGKYGSDMMIDHFTGDEGGLQGAIGKLGDNTYGEVNKLLEAWEEERESVTALDRQNSRNDAIELQKQILKRKLGKEDERAIRQLKERFEEEERNRKEKEWELLEALKKRFKKQEEEKKKAEKEKAEKEKAEKEKAEKERAEKEKAEIERAKREAAEREQAKKESEKAERERAAAEKAKKEAELEAKKKAIEEAEKRRVHEENLRKLGNAVESGMIEAIKSQLRSAIDSADTQDARDQLKRIIKNIQEALRQEARNNNRAMQSAIDRGQADQRRKRVQWGVVSQTIVDVLQQYGGTTGGRAGGGTIGGTTGSTTGGSGAIHPGGNNGGSPNDNSGLCQQLQRQLEKNGNDTVRVSREYGNSGKTSLANEIERLRTEQQRLIRRMKEADCPGVSSLPF